MGGHPPSSADEGTGGDPCASLDLAAPSADLRTSLAVVSDETERASEPDESDADNETTDGTTDEAGDETTEDDLELEPSKDPVDTARRRHGMAGAVLAAGMFGVDMALGRKPREDIPVVVASSSEPTDIDAEGIRLDVDEQTTVVAPALPRRDPPARGRRGRRARRSS